MQKQSPTSRVDKVKPAEKSPRSNGAEKANASHVPPVPVRGQSNGGPVFKLMFFSLLILVLPLLTYYQSLKYLANATYSAIAATLMANVVLFVFIIVAVREDMPKVKSS